MKIYYRCSTNTLSLIISPFVNNTSFKLANLAGITEEEGSGPLYSNVARLLALSSGIGKADDKLTRILPLLLLERYSYSCCKSLSEPGKGRELCNDDVSGPEPLVLATTVSETVVRAELEASLSSGACLRLRGQRARTYM